MFRPLQTVTRSLKESRSLEENLCSQGGRKGKGDTLWNKFQRIKMILLGLIRDQNPKTRIIKIK